MTRSVPLLVLLALAVPAVADSKKPKPQTHTSEDGLYSVIFPAEPSSSEKKVASTGGNLTIQTTRAEFAGVIYSVTFTDYPESFGAVSADKVLDGVRDGMKGNDGSIKKEEKTSLDGVPGRELRIEAGKNAIRCRTFLVKQRLYQVMVTASSKDSKGTVDGDEAEQFFRSFSWAK